jgi:hypothetical protein
MKKMNEQSQFKTLILLNKIYVTCIYNSNNKPSALLHVVISLIII